VHSRVTRRVKFSPNGYGYGWALPIGYVPVAIVTSITVILDHHLGRRHYVNDDNVGVARGKVFFFFLTIPGKLICSLVPAFCLGHTTKRCQFFFFYKLSRFLSNCAGTLDQLLWSGTYLAVTFVQRIDVPMCPHMYNSIAGYIFGSLFVLACRCTHTCTIVSLVLFYICVGEPHRREHEI
jgi:hypothetical protein